MYFTALSSLARASPCLAPIGSFAAPAHLKLHLLSTLYLHLYLIISCWWPVPSSTLLPSPVGLSAHQQEGSFGAAVVDLRHPLGLDVLEAGVEHDAEADQEHVCVGVGDGPQPVVGLLARRVEQGQVAGLPTAEYRGFIRYIVLDKILLKYNQSTDQRHYV